MYSQAQANPYFSTGYPTPNINAINTPLTNTTATNVVKTKSEITRLNAFLAQCLSIGCLKGFKYFEMYLRGREELLMRVYNDPNAATNRNGKPNSVALARSKSRNLLAMKSQHRLAWQSTDALPPASPCDREMEKDTTKTVFLIAAYAKYKFPLVWLRTNHAKLAKIISASKEDYPVKLETVAAWKNSDAINLSDILAEIVSLAVTPPPINPFAIDHSIYSSLPIEESLVCVSAILDFLHKIYLGNTPYSELVLPDIELLTQRMWSEMGEMASVPPGVPSLRRSNSLDTATNPLDKSRGPEAVGS